jgi:hypothetical protein
LTLTSVCTQLGALPSEERRLGELGEGRYLLEGGCGLKMLWVASGIVFIINLPFGYWRSRARRFSKQWIFAIHAPVPLVIGCRLLMGLGWHLITFPFLAGAFFAGQFAGGLLGQVPRTRKPAAIHSASD